METIRWRLVILALGLGLAGSLASACQEDRVEFPITPDAYLEVTTADTEEEVSPPTDISGDADDAGGDAEVTSPGNPVGRACADDDDCGGFTCVDDALLVAFGSDLTIPNGMCSSLLCDDTSCGDGATCVDLEPAFGAPVKICLKECVGLASCRWEEAYSCAQPIAGDERFVCLPDNIIVAIECDDGHCDQE